MFQSTHLLEWESYWTPWSNCKQNQKFKRERERERERGLGIDKRNKTGFVIL